MNPTIIIPAHPETIEYAESGLVQKYVKVPVRVMTSAASNGINKILVIEQGTFSIAVELSNKEAQLIAEKLLES